MPVTIGRGVTAGGGASDPPGGAVDGAVGRVDCGADGPIVAPPDGPPDGPAGAASASAGRTTVAMRLSVAVEKYTYAVWSRDTLGDTAMPRRPPSPVESTPDTVAIGVTARPLADCGGPTRTIVPVVRSVTSALPSGKNATPHGALRCFARTSIVALPSVPPPKFDGVGLGRFGGSPPSSGG